MNNELIILNKIDKKCNNYLVKNILNYRNLFNY